MHGDPVLNDIYDFAGKGCSVDELFADAFAHGDDSHQPRRGGRDAWRWRRVDAKDVRNFKAPSQGACETSQVRVLEVNEIGSLIANRLG